MTPIFSRVPAIYRDAAGTHRGYLPVDHSNNEFDVVKGWTFSAELGSPFERAVELGQLAEVGDLVRRVHFNGELIRDPEELLAPIDGLVAATRQPTTVTPGGILVNIATAMTNPHYSPQGTRTTCTIPAIHTR